jgi:hypothetical protein
VFRCSQMIRLDAKRYAYSKPASAEAIISSSEPALPRKLAALQAVTADAREDSP